LSDDREEEKKENQDEVKVENQNLMTPRKSPFENVKFSPNQIEGFSE
jgi:hypothetical protein